MNKTTKKINNQRGSALLLTLGILSLVLILAMSFAFTARTNRQVAKVNADQVKARLLAESALERLMAAMRISYDGVVYPPTPPTPPPAIPPAMVFSQATLSEAGASQSYLASSGSGGYSFNASDSEKLPILNFFASLPSSGYQNIIVRNHNNVDKTIGRIAFFVLEEANKLDINQILSLNSGIPFVRSGAERLASFRESCATGDFFFDILGDGTSSTMSPDFDGCYEANTVRLGLQMQELHADARYFLALQRGFWDSSDPTQQTRTHWFSYSHLWNRLGRTDTSQGAYDGNGIFANVSGTVSAPIPAGTLRYTFFSGEDIEAYWDGTTERHRFDVTGYEWGGWEHNGDLDGARRLVTELVGSSSRQAFSGTSPAEPNYSLTDDDPATGGFGIPYLVGMRDDGGKDVSRQVAANMVDFCDSDDTPTYPKPAQWDKDSEPDYFGNERLSYINEIAFEFVGTRTLNPPYDVELTIRPKIELVNIYKQDDGLLGNVIVTVYGRGTKKVNGGAEENISSGGNFTASFGPITLVNIAAESFFTITTLPPLAFSPFTLDSSTGVNGTLDGTPPVDGPPPQISYNIEITKIKVERVNNATPPSIWYDFAFWEGTWGFNTEADSSINFLLGQTTGIYSSLEAKDSRCNHRTIAWDWMEDILTSKTYSTTLGFDSLGSQNTNFIPSDVAGNDLEPGPFYSTAFIPNRPFRTLWELGAIHRGEPYRTLNLSLFTDPAPIPPAPPSGYTGIYIQGDAAILDQVKIGPIKRICGKYNANSSNPVAFEELLRGVNLTDQYGGPYSYLTPTYTLPASLSATTSTNRGIFASRIPNSGLYTPEPANDREREALIGRTANLLTTRMDKYSILVVGQALMELDGVSNLADVQDTAINPISYNSGVYSILASQRILAHVVRDAWRNEYKIVQMQLLED